MRLDKLTIKTREALVAAQSLAQQKGQPELQPEHVLYALLAQKEGLVPALLQKTGADPQRMLLLSFSRRAADSLQQRVAGLLHRGLNLRGTQPAPLLRWSGTFHSVAARLLREQAQRIGLHPDFTIADRGDSEDLMGWVRQEQGLARSHHRFPLKGTCMAIYSRVLNRPGVCIAQNGPGITNFVTAIAAAYWAHSPVVMITPGTGSGTMGLGGFQETEQLPIFSKITKYQAHVSRPDRIAELTNRAFHMAMLERGPTQVNIPRDFFYGEIDVAIPQPIRISRGPGSSESLDEAARLMDENAVRRLPVIEGSKLVGIISHGNLVQAAGSEGAADRATLGVTRGA